MQIIKIEENNMPLEMHALNNLVVEKVEVFLELKHKTVNAALGSQMDASLLKKLSLEMMYQKITVASMLEE
jgi:hypothetical protein